MNQIKKNILTVYGLLLSTLFQLIALNCFYLNTHLTTGGVSGIALSGMYILKYFHLNATFGTIYFAFNLPLFIYAWFTINKRFTIYSMLNVLLVSFLSDLLPVIHLTNDLLINCIFGAVFFAFAIVFALHYGHSTGGTDILGVIFTKKGIGSIGIINIVVSIAAFTMIMFVKEFTILGYSLLSETLLSLIVDKFYHHGIKETVVIVSENNSEQIKKAIITKLERGCTIIKSKGGFSNKDNTTIMVVVSKDQLKVLQSIVHKLDSNAFINSWTTTSLKGEWTDRIGEHKYTLTDIKRITREINNDIEN